MQHYTQLSPQYLFVYSDQTDCCALWQNDSDSQRYLYTLGCRLKNSSLSVRHYLLFHLSFALVNLSFVITIMIMRIWSVMTLRELSAALFPDIHSSYVREVKKRTKCAISSEHCATNGTVVCVAVHT